MNEKEVTDLYIEHAIKKKWNNVSISFFPGYVIVSVAGNKKRMFEYIDRITGVKGSAEFMYKVRYFEYTAGKYFRFCTGYFPGRV